MAIPQVDINTNYIKNTQNKVSALSGSLNETSGKINSCKTCSELEALQDRVDNTITPEFNKFKGDTEAYYTQKLAEIQKSLNKLKPLLINPTNLNSVIRWIKNMIALIKEPYTNVLKLQIQLLQDQAKMNTKLAELQSKISDLQSGVNSKATELKWNVSKK